MNSGKVYTTSDIKHEMACVLFNIGGLHLNLGTIDNRQTEYGIKMSCSHFQQAAWAFQQLNEKYPQPRETDLCYEIVQFLSTVSLAQAQECILEKCPIDRRKPGYAAKVICSNIIPTRFNRLLSIGCRSSCRLLQGSFKDN